jgi:CRP-like cAMP-binding protein
MKMEQFTAFSDVEKRRLDELISDKQDHHASKDDIITKGAHSDHCYVVLSGLACRYKLLPMAGVRSWPF